MRSRESSILRAKRLVAELGVRDALCYRLDMLLSGFRDGEQNGPSGIGRMVTYGIYAQPLRSSARQQPGPERRSGGTEYRVVNPDDPLLETLGLGGALEFRLAQKATCVGAVRDERLIGAIWFVSGAYIEDEVRCTYQMQTDNHAVWDFGVHIDPAYRMSPVFARLWRKAESVMVAQGAGHSFSRILAYNPQSVRAHENLGAKRVGKVRFLNLFGLQIMWGNVPPYVHLSLPGRPGPVLRVGADPE